MWESHTVMRFSVRVICQCELEPHSRIFISLLVLQLSNCYICIQQEHWCTALDVLDRWTTCVGYLNAWVSLDVFWCSAIWTLKHNRQGFSFQKLLFSSSLCILIPDYTKRLLKTYLLSSDVCITHRLIASNEVSRNLWFWTFGICHLYYLALW